MSRKYKVGFLYYSAGLQVSGMFRRLAQLPAIDLTVCYISEVGISELFDPETGFSLGSDLALFEGYRSEFLSRQSIRKYLGGINRRKFDIFVVAGYTRLICWLTFLKAIVSGVPIFLRADTTLLYQNQLPLWQKIAKRLLSWVLFRMFKGFLATGKLSKNCFQYYGVPEEKIFIVPYEADNEYFQASCSIYKSSRKALREEFGISPDKLVILGIVKFIERERPMDLIMAYERLKNRDRASLILVGDGRQRKRIEEYIRQNKLKGIYLFGYRKYSELPKFYAVSDIFVHPAIVEPWGLSVNEAMACGLPVVTTDMVGSAYDLIQEGKNGFIYPAGDIASLTLILEKFIEEPSLCEQFGYESVKIISSWGYDRCINGIITAIKSSIKQR